MKKSHSSARPANQNRRSLLVFVIIAVVAGMLIGWLAYIQLVNGDKYTAKVQEQMRSDNKITASRGTIYDANMNVLAQSASAWQVMVYPKQFSTYSDENREKIRNIVAVELARCLEMDVEDVTEYLNGNDDTAIKSGIEKATKDEIEEFISKYAEKENGGYNLNKVISIEPDVKRYYPYSCLASTVIGFLDADGNGIEGLESYYDDVLKGTAGRTITAIDGRQNAMPNSYETIFEPQPGKSIVLTIDKYVQYILEDVLSQALEETKAQNIYGIVMDVETGAVLGMASMPDYDLNNPRKIKSDEIRNAYYEAASEPEDPSATANEKYMRSLNYFQNMQWRNRAVSSTYEPGSVFKIITTSAAVEEGVATYDRTFFCNGVIDFASRKIKCWKTGGHGAETLEDLLKNSCNPFAVTIASELGRDKFYDYFEAFGFTEKTGIDTTGDLTPAAGQLYISREDFSQSDLASYSFGQSFQVSPLQVITAVSAVANGGKLMQPYLVSKIIDSDGNTVSETSPVVRRQVISESTAKLIRDNMEQVVSTGTGKNAYVAGYHVAGKTGTSEKLTKSENEAYVASFCGFAPANDPKISVIVVVDEPVGEHGGSAVAAPLAGDIFEQVLSYLGVEHSYNDTEAELLVASAPQLIGKTVSEARSAADSSGLNIKIVGSGDVVVAQYPDSGRDIPTDGIIVAYTDEENASSTVTVPNFSGCTISEANKLAASNGLNIKISGGSTNNGSFYAYKQSLAPGTQTDMGEIITVSFKTTVDVGD